MRKSFSWKKDGTLNVENPSPALGPLAMIVCGDGTRYWPLLPFICSRPSATGLIAAVVAVFRLAQSSCLAPAYVWYRAPGGLPGQNCAASAAAERSSVSGGRIMFDIEVGSSPLICRVP